MAAPAAELTPSPLASRRRLIDRIGDTALHLLTGAAALFSIVISAAIAYGCIYGAWPAIQAFGLPFVWHQDWNPVTNEFGALAFLYGTAVTSFAAVLIAGPLAIAIGALPERARADGGARRGRLAGRDAGGGAERRPRALGDPRARPVRARPLEPVAPSASAGPVLRRTPQQAAMFAAVLVLAIMIVPITVEHQPRALQASRRTSRRGRRVSALTRWEMVRGVVCPVHARRRRRGGPARMGRAVGEAIAVTQVIGGFAGIPTSLFQPGDTLASRIAAQYQGGSLEPARRLDRLPRADPARLLTADELRRAGDRQPLRGPAGGRLMAAQAQPSPLALGRRPGPAAQAGQLGRRGILASGLGSGGRRARDRHGLGLPARPQGAEPRTSSPRRRRHSARAAAASRMRSSAASMLVGIARRSRCRSAC